MKKPGFLVVFEGPDGTGKSTLVNALQRSFALQKDDWEILAFPGNGDGTLGKHIYNLHHNPSHFEILDMYPESLQVLHVAAHIDAIETRILPLLKSGKNIFLDRFWWSTWVYGVLSGVNRHALDKLIDLEVYHWQNNLPNLFVLVDRQQPLKKENSLEVWQNLRALYLSLLETEKLKYPIQILNNDGSVEEAVTIAVKMVRQYCCSINSTGKQIMIDPIQTLESNQDNGQLSLPFIDRKVVRGSHSNPSPKVSRIYPVIPTKVYDTYWYFAAERQNIFFRRLSGCSNPLTSDSILANYKFTNAYRASDRVSQYLIKEVIYKGRQSPEELFFRIILFKVFNRISTWKLLLGEFSEVTLSDYSYHNYDRVLKNTIQSGEPIFSAAYIMPSGGKGSPYSFKHQVFLKLIEKMLDDKVPYQLSIAPSMQSAFEILRSYPLIGDFLAYQYIIDINYSVLINFSESEFVIPGPGARNGIRKCFSNFGGLSEIDLIRLVADIQDEEFARLGIEFKSLWGRRLQLIDCQNLFCEVDKYARVAHPDVIGITDRKRIKQVYKAMPEPIEFWYPPKWGINQLIQGGIYS